MTVVKTIKELILKAKTKLNKKVPTESENSIIPHGIQFEKSERLDTKMAINPSENFNEFEKAIKGKYMPQEELKNNNLVDHGYAFF